MARYAATSHAVGCSQGSTWVVAESGMAAWDLESRRATGTQASAPTAASMLHDAREPCHDPNRAARGTDNADEAAAPPIKANMYRPVTAPVRSGGNAALTRRGSSVPATAMPNPAPSVPAYRAQSWSPHHLRRTPANNAIIAIWTETAAPSRAPMRCAAGAMSPMQSTGRGVTAPIHAWDRSSSAAMVLARGGTLAMATRRFADTATRA